MKYNAIIIFLCAVPAILLFVFLVVVPRLRMKRRASALLAEHSRVEQASVYLELHSTFAGVQTF
jgi:hypothetical protein